ncbi:unnamed protein product [Coregonus sp. 'balchen']|nr:unnamed protein product [Coregonus sp. 'balchen']
MADSLRRLVNTSSLSVMQDKLECWYKDYHESVEKERKIRELSASHENDMQKMETQLCSTRLQLESIKQELADTHLQLDDTKNMSATTLLATEDEILQLKAELRAACDQVETYKRKLNILDDYERQGRLLRDEVSFLTAEKSMLQERLVRSRSPSPLPRRRHHSSPLRSESPTRAQLTNSSRHARLVSRFSDLYAVERLEAQSLLRQYIDDPEMVQIIIFIATVEAFQAAKLAYRQFKLRVRKTLSPSHLGPEILEDSVVDYIVRNLDLYDVQASINDVINAMNVNPRISFPPEVDFVLISGFIRETCRVAGGAEAGATVLFVLTLAAPHALSPLATAEAPLLDVSQPVASKP